MPGTDTIFQRDPPLAVLTLNRPEALNAMTWAMYQALADACDRVDRDDDVRVFVLPVDLDDANRWLKSYTGREVELQ